MDLSFVPKKHRDKLGEPEAPPPATRALSVLPRNMSEIAASAAQHVVNLEEEIESLKRAVDLERNRADRAEAACQNLHEDLEKTRNERDRYQATAIDIQTRLQVAGKVILDAMAMPAAREIALKEKAMAAVESAVNEVKAAAE